MNWPLITTTAARNKLVADREKAEEALADAQRRNAVERAGEAKRREPLLHYNLRLERQVAALEQEFRNLPSELARPRTRIQELTKLLADANDEIERLRRAANPGPAVPLPAVDAPGSNEDTVPVPMVWALGSQAWRTQKQMADLSAQHRGVA